MTKRDLDMADITAIYEFHAKTAVGIINESERDLMPQLVAVHMYDEPGKIRGLMMVDPGLVNAMQRSNYTKELLMMAVRRLLNTPGDDAPDAVVHVSEMWTVSSNTGMDADGLLDGCEQVKDHPNRTEALMVNVHTLTRSYPGICPIENDGGKRRAVFKPLDPTTLGVGALFIESEELVRH